MAEIRVTVDDDGRAMVDLAGGSGGEIRDTVALEELEASESIPALESIVLHFDFYGRLAQIEIPDSALPPSLVDGAE
jgi:hypothetical protein